MRPDLLDFQREGVDVNLDGTVTHDDSAALTAILNGIRLFIVDMEVIQLTDTGNACRLRLSLTARHKSGTPATAQDANILFDVESTSPSLRAVEQLIFVSGQARNPRSLSTIDSRCISTFSHAHGPAVAAVGNVGLTWLDLTYCIALHLCVGTGNGNHQGGVKWLLVACGRQRQWAVCGGSAVVARGRFDRCLCHPGT